MEYTRLAHESVEYVAAREELRLAEIELMEHRERVAALRRGLPEGPRVEDYVFLEGPRSLDEGDDPVRPVRLSELFTAPGRPLVVYHLMFGKADTEPCPMCTQWIDGFNGIAQHLAQNVDFVVVAAADPVPLRRHARDRGWDRLRLLSCGDNSFKYDLRSEGRDGVQDSTVSVFELEPGSGVRHTYTTRPSMSEESRERGIDLLCATWHILDLTRQGRGDWYSSLSYGLSVSPPSPPSRSGSA